VVSNIPGVLWTLLEPFYSVVNGFFFYQLDYLFCQQDRESCFYEAKSIQKLHTLYTFCIGIKFLQGMGMPATSIAKANQGEPCLNSRIIKEKTYKISN